MMLRGWTVIVVLMGILAGCSNSSVQRVAGQSFPSRAGDFPIDVYIGNDTPAELQQQVPDARPPAKLPQNSVAIGWVNMNGAQLSSWSSLVDAARGKARDLGGNGLVVKAVSQPLVGYDGFGMPHNGKYLSMAVVRYLE